MIKKIIAWLRSWRISDIDLELFDKPCRSFEDAGKRFLRKRF